MSEAPKKEAQGEMKGELSGKFTVIWGKQPEGGEETDSEYNIDMSERSKKGYTDEEAGSKSQTPESERDRRDYRPLRVRVCVRKG